MYLPMETDKDGHNSTNLIIYSCAKAARTASTARTTQITKTASIVQTLLLHNCQKSCKRKAARRKKRPLLARKVDKSNNKKRILSLR